MKELKEYVRAAQQGDVVAFGEIVRRFQNMAYGCAYAVLGDFHQAEDATQEAFIEAYRKLGDLREPKAFPGWLRRIVLTRCGRVTRRKRIVTVPLDEAVAVESTVDGPEVAVQRAALKDSVLKAIDLLPSAQRMATTLFYINGYSHQEVAEFLDVPVSTVKKRLYDSRRKLKERMDGMISDTLKTNAPDSEEKAGQVRMLLSMAAQMERGTPLLAVFDTLIQETNAPGLKDALWQMVATIKKGRNLSDAMAGCSSVFPPMVVALIRDGEWIGRVDLGCKLAGAWLRTGTCTIAQDLYRETRSPVDRLLQKAQEAGACAIMIDPTEAKVMKPGPACPVFRPAFILSDESRKDYDMLLLDRQMSGIEQDIKRRTILDSVQRGDELMGMLEWPAPAGTCRCRISFLPMRNGTVIRLDLRNAP